MGGSQLACDAELEQLWKQPQLLRKMFRWGAWGAFGDALMCLCVPLQSRALTGQHMRQQHRAAHGQHMGSSVSQHSSATAPSPSLVSLLLLQPVRYAVRAPAAAAGRGRQAAAAAASHEEAVRRLLGFPKRLAAAAAGHGRWHCWEHGAGCQLPRTCNNRDGPAVVGGVSTNLPCSEPSLAHAPQGANVWRR